MCYVYTHMQFFTGKELLKINLVFLSLGLELLQTPSLVHCTKQILESEDRSKVLAREQAQS